MSAELATHPAADLFPMLDGPELAGLAVDIAAHGLREPVWLWRDPGDGTEYLLDGRNRVAACAKAGVDVRAQHYVGDDPFAFAVSLNLQRRHLNAGQRAFLALEVEAHYAEQAKQRQGERTDLKRRGNIPADPPECVGQRERESRECAAAVTGASGRNVSTAKRIREQAPDLVPKVTGGELAIDRADRIIRDRQAEQRRVEQARREAAAVGAELIVDIRHGDFRDVLADVEGVDAIITDPPYPHEFIAVLADLAAFADKALKPEGVLAVLIGQMYLPEVYRLLDGGRPYRWTGCYLTAGAGYVSHPRKVQSNWKPLIVYGGGPRFSDVIRTGGSDADAKNNHRWGQDYSAFHTIIERLTERGQTVVDPFMGSGTTLLAAHAQCRDVIGCDIDAESVTRARKRLT